MQKPISCEHCPASKKDKKALVCLVSPKNKVKDLHDTLGLFEMYKNCPLDWENKNKRRDTS